MSLFTKILEKVGLKKPEAQSAPAAAPKPATPAPAAPKPAAPVAAAPAKPAAPAQPVAKPASAVGAKPASADPAFGREEDMEDLRRVAAAKPASAPAVTPVSEVDVVAKIEKMAEGSPLNWKSSIVDLLKILGLDSDKDARIELAKELGCPAELIGGDYSKMNVWLHKEVLKQIAQNGGNIPKELLD